MYSSFEELIKKRINIRKEKSRIAVVCANSRHTLEAVAAAYAEELVEPLLIGNKNEILPMIRKTGFTDEPQILNANTTNQALEIMIDLAVSGGCDVIMKGHIDTRLLMHTIIDKKNGLNEGRVISSLAMMRIPGYHKLVAITDSGIVMYPDLKMKKELILNAVDTMHRLGYDRPKVGILCAVDKVNPKMPETVDAEELTRLGNEGEFGNCSVYGPLSYDLLIDKEAAEIKECKSDVAADVDIILVPDINSGNALSKAITYSAGGEGGAVITGAKLPVIFSSRASSKQDKYNSIVLTAALC